MKRSMCQHLIIAVIASSLDHRLCGAGADVAVECEVPAAGAGGGEA